MRNYAPKYFLINGKPYDPAAAAPSILVAAGTTHLLRFANAGVQPHSMTALGLRQQVLAIDGNRYTIDGVTPYSQMVAAQTIQPGQTSDVLVAIPATPNVHYALYDANLLLNNNNVSAANFGGMLTFLDAGTTAGSGKPTTSNTALAPSTTNGSGRRGRDRQGHDLLPRSTPPGPPSTSSTPRASTETASRWSPRHARRASTCAARSPSRSSPAYLRGSTPSTSTPRTARAGARSTATGRWRLRSVRASKNQAMSRAEM